MPALFLSAPSGTGKTYAVCKALACSGSAFFGLMTYKVKHSSPTHTDIFIVSVTGNGGLPMQKGAPRLVATSRADASYCAKMGATENASAQSSVPASERGNFAHIFPNAFDDAAAFIENAQNKAEFAGRILLLDELGRLEQEATRFQKAVLDALMSPQKTIGVIQKASTPFLDLVRQNECVSVLEFEGDKLDVREKMYAAAMDFIIS